MRHFPIFLILGFFLSGCSKTPKCGSDAVFSLVSERIDKEVYWNIEGENRAVIEELLLLPLTIDGAVQIALLNNPEIQEAFEEVGIAHADLVQAGLLKNPMIGGWVRFPEQSHAKINTEFSLAQNFLDLMLIPLRKRIAEAEYEQAQLKVANRIINIGFDVEETYLDLLTENTKKQFMMLLVDVADAAYELAKGQLESGNINELEYQGFLSEYLEKKAELAKTQNNVVTFREKLSRLLGLSGSGICWEM